MTALLRFLQIIIIGQDTKLEYWSLGYKTLPYQYFIDRSDLILKVHDPYLYTKLLMQYKLSVK